MPVGATPPRWDRPPSMCSQWHLSWATMHCARIAPRARDNYPGVPVFAFMGWDVSLGSATA
eukprot:13037580-Alexandrium_andersonii.AAC.1